jgi:hypothetical protein
VAGLGSKGAETCHALDAGERGLSLDLPRERRRRFARLHQLCGPPEPPDPLQNRSGVAGTARSRLLFSERAFFVAPLMICPRSLTWAKKKLFVLMEQHF